jgi:uncharacterized repeat protein (TIGR03803 family)
MMLRIRRMTGRYILSCSLSLVMLGIPQGAHARSSKTILYSFNGGSDGAKPEFNLIADKAGSLYGATTAGGGSAECFFSDSIGCGAIFKLAPDGTESVVYAFQGGSDGAEPFDIIWGSRGNILGTTAVGGANVRGGAGCGTVFRLAPNGTKRVLHAFLDGSDGCHPAGLIRDRAGNLYGVTGDGGGTGCDTGCGTVFKIASRGTYSVLYRFAGDSDGFQPFGLIADESGNLYGTTVAGGGLGCPGGGGCGTIFKLTPGGIETVLYAFGGGNDGAEPITTIIADKAGNFYGMTYRGGVGSCISTVTGCGTVFKFAPDGTETILYSFLGGNDGALPGGRLIEDYKGNLYGTTSEGGGSNACSDIHGTRGCGIIFELAQNGTESVLYSFQGANDGAAPNELNRVAHETHAFYATTNAGGGNGCGGAGCGTLFVFER